MDWTWYGPIVRYQKKFLVVVRGIDIVFCKFVLDDDKRPKVRLPTLRPKRSNVWPPRERLCDVLPCAGWAMIWRSGSIKPVHDRAQPTAWSSCRSRVTVCRLSRLAPLRHRLRIEVAALATPR